MKLYDINTEIHTVQMMLEEWAQEHEGDITDFPLNDNLAGITMDRETKLLSIACVIKDYEADADGLDAEIEKINKRKKSVQSKADSMRSWLERNLTIGEKLKDSRAEIGWSKSTSVGMTQEYIDKPELLPVIYQRKKIEPDKKGISAALKTGIIIEGCSLVTRQNMQIK